MQTIMPFDARACLSGQAFTLQSTSATAALLGDSLFFHILLTSNLTHESQGSLHAASLRILGILPS